MLRRARTAQHLIPNCHVSFRLNEPWYFTASTGRHSRAKPSCAQA